MSICSYFVMTRKVITIDGDFICWEDEHPGLVAFLETEVGSVADLDVALSKLNKEDRKILEKGWENGIAGAITKAGKELIEAYKDEK